MILEEDIYDKLEEPDDDENVRRRVLPLSALRGRSREYDIVRLTRTPCRTCSTSPSG